MKLLKKYNNLVPFYKGDALTGIFPIYQEPYFKINTFNLNVPYKLFSQSNGAIVMYDLILFKPWIE